MKIKLKLINIKLIIVIIFSGDFKDIEYLKYLLIVFIINEQFLLVITKTIKQYDLNCFNWEFFFYHSITNK